VVPCVILADAGVTLMVVKTGGGGDAHAGSLDPYKRLPFLSRPKDPNTASLHGLVGLFGCAVSGVK